MIVDIGIYTHRWSQWQVKCMESVAWHTKRSFNLILVCEPGSCHVNMNRVLRRSTERYLCLLDEDVAILQDQWLDVLLETIQKPDVAIVGCPDVKREAELSYALQAANERAPVEERLWIPAHVMLIDRERAPFLCFDEAIPGQMCMTDLDACLQVRAKGLKVMRDHRTVVFHPMRNEPDVRQKEGRPSCEDQQKWFPYQVAYMEKKWGELYRQSNRQGM